MRAVLHQRGGQTRLFAGSKFEVPKRCQVTGGTLAGDGLVVGNVINSGTVSPGFGLGRLTIDGHYTQTAAGVLAIELGGAATNLHDRLQITNTSRLGHAGGHGSRQRWSTTSCQPSTMSFTFLTVAPGTRTGTFASFAHPTYLGMTLDYTANTASMRVTNIAPNPLLAAPASRGAPSRTSLGDDIWKLYPRLTWPAMVGAEYYILHTTNVASTNWSAWPDSGPPLNLPVYITATQAVMTVDGPAVGTRVHPVLSTNIIETVEPAHFFRMQFRPDP